MLSLFPILSTFSYPLWKSTNRSFRYAFPYPWNKLPKELHKLSTVSPYHTHLISHTSSSHPSSPFLHPSPLFRFSLKTYFSINPPYQLLDPSAFQPDFADFDYFLTSLACLFCRFLILPFFFNFSFMC